MSTAGETLSAIISFIDAREGWWNEEIARCLSQNDEEDLTTWLEFARAADDAELVRHSLLKFVHLVEEGQIEWVTSDEELQEISLLRAAREQARRPLKI